jgi:hypothetical protein
MRGARCLRVPELLEERGWAALDLIQRPEFLLPPATAYRLARKDEHVRSLSLDILEKLSRGFGVAVDELWIWEDKSG